MADECVDKLELRSTDDYEAIRHLALASGLEDGSFQQTVAAFGFYMSGKLVGCASLRRDGERYSVDWLAVDQPLRGRGLGNKLVTRVAGEAKTRGADRLWALARAPDFFEKIGFRRSSEKDGVGPSLDNCLQCPQFRRNCSPAIMIIDL